MHGYLGRFQLGDFVPVTVSCRDTGFDEIAASAAPVLNVYAGGSDTPVVDDQSIPPLAKGVRTGWFQFEIRLSSSFAVGRYDVLVTYSFSGGTGAAQFSFDVVAGGNASGAYIALTHYQRPHNSFIVGQTDAGVLESRKAPRL